MDSTPGTLKLALNKRENSYTKMTGMSRIYRTNAARDRSLVMGCANGARLLNEKARLNKTAAQRATCARNIDVTPDRSLGLMRALMA